MTTLKLGFFSNPRKSNCFHTGFTPFQFGLLAVLCLLSICGARAQKTVFVDNFNGFNPSFYRTTNGVISSSNWTLTKSGTDMGARIYNGVLDETNTGNPPITTGANGWAFASTTTSSFAAPFNSILDNNEGQVVWSFNFRQSQTNPSGYSQSVVSYGTSVAYVLAASSSDINAVTTRGYALILDQYGSPDVDVLSVIHFETGLVNYDKLLTPITSGIPSIQHYDVQDEYISAKVSFNPFTKIWDLSFSKIDASYFGGDPPVGSDVLYGSGGVDATNTGISLGYMGCYWQAIKGASKNAKFDHIIVAIEPLYPRTQSLIASQDFGSQEFSQFPFAIVGWKMDGSAISTKPQAEVSVASANSGVVPKTGDFISQPSGGMYGHSVGGNGRLTIATDGTSNGLNQPVAGISKNDDQTSVLVSYDLTVSYPGTKPMGTALQYKTGKAGTNWTTVSGSDQIYGTSPPTTTVSKSLLVQGLVGIDPDRYIENQFFRWISWRDGTIGTTNTAIALDNVKFSVPTVANFLSLEGFSPPASNHVQGSPNVILQRIDLSLLAGSSNNITGLNFTTNGTYTSTDLSSLKLRYSTDSILDGGDATLATLTLNLGPGAKAFSFAAQALTAGATRYIFITADIAGSATGGATLYSEDVKSLDLIVNQPGYRLGTFPLRGGTIRTILGPPTVQSPPTSNSASGTLTLSGNATSSGGSTLSERGFWYSTTNGFATGTGTKISSSGSFGAGAFSETATLSANTIYYFKSFATNAQGTAYSTQGTFTTPKAEPATSPTSFACGTSGLTSIQLNWVDAPTAGGYLIRWSTVGYASILDPTDYTAISDGITDKNVTQGVQTYSLSGIPPSTTYYFKIYAYSNSGTNINYRIATVQTTCATLTGIIEDFEIGTKTTYASASVTCRLGSWTMSEALIGTSGSDIKNGLQSVRIRGSNSYLSMDFDLPNGVGSVSLKHARYSSDASSTWRLEGSLDGGVTWPLTYGTTTSSSATLITGNFTVDNPNPIRFRIFKLTSASISNRTNIDDIVFSPYCTPPTTTGILTLANITESTVNASWTNAAGNGTMLVIRPTAITNVLPAPGTSYVASLNILSATQLPTSSQNYVVYRASGSSASGIFNLQPATQYTATAYNYNTTKNCYQLNSPAANSFYTLAQKPLAHGIIGATPADYNQINLYFSAPPSLADGYIILQKIGSVPTGLPANATAYTVGETIGDATVAAITTTPVIGTNITNLLPETDYYFTLIPYNWTGGIVTTHNYRTDATIPSANATTFVQYSETSDVIADPTFQYSSDIDYRLYQGSPNTYTNSIGVFRFLIRDGGGTKDLDLYSTILDKLDIVITGSSNIESWGLYGGNNQDQLFVSGNVSGNVLSLEELGVLDSSFIMALDGESKAITLRITFKPVVTDNDQLVFSIGSSTIFSKKPDRSQFGAFPTAKSSTTSNRNRIEVVASKIGFSNQPADIPAETYVYLFKIQAIDNFGNTDIDQQGPCNVVVTKGTGVLGGMICSFVAGFQNGIIRPRFNFFTPQTGTTIKVTSSGCFGSYVITTNTFTVTPTNPYLTGDWKPETNASPRNWATLQWQKYNGSAFVNTAGLPASTDRVFIQSSITISTTVSVKELINENLGQLYVNSNLTVSDKMIVESGSTLSLNSPLILSSSSKFIVADGGNVRMGFSCNNGSPIWAGEEQFGEYSNISILTWDVNNATSSLRSIFNGSNITLNDWGTGYYAPFGNLIIELYSALPNTVLLLGNGVTANLAHGNLTFKTLSTTSITLYSGTSSAFSGVKGSVSMHSLSSDVGTVDWNTAGDLNFTVGGNVIFDHGNSRLITGNTSGMATKLTIGGNLEIKGTASIEYNSVSASSVLVDIFLKGDLLVETGANLKNTSSSAGVGNYVFHFSGNGDGLSSASTQEMNIGSSSTTLENVNILFKVESGAYVKLLNNNLELGQNSELRVEGNATFDFGFSSTNVPLVVNVSGTSTGTKFTTLSGSTLKITSPGGITTSAAAGNVLIPAAGRSFSQTGTFWFNGLTNQNTGDVIQNTGLAKDIYCQLGSNSVTLTLNNDLVFPAGSKLEIRKGILLETPTTQVTGGGYLVMEDGVYKSSVIDQTIPQLADYARFALSAGTIELNGIGSQILPSAIPQYFNVAVSNTGTKTLIGRTLVNNNVNISNGELDVSSIGIYGNAGLTMTGGTLKVGKTTTGTAFPELTGIATPYSLTGGTVELYGARGAGDKQILRTTYGVASASVVSYFNLTLNSLAGDYVDPNIEPETSFSLAGTMRVKAPTVFGLDYNKIVSGTGSFFLDSAATLKYAEKNGITPSACGTGISCGQIRTTNRTFSPKGYYWLSGAQASTFAGNGLPSTVEYLIVNRSALDVTLSQDVTVKKRLALNGQGKIQTATNKIILSDTAQILEQEIAHVTGRVQTTRTLGLTNHDFGGLGLEIDADGSSPGITVVERYTGLTVSGAGNQGVKRKFSIVPTTNTGLNATLVFNYFDDEINGLDENYLSLYRSTDGGITWSQQTAVPDPALNLVTKTGINAFSEWTLGDVNVPLPLSIVSFGGKPGEGKSYLEWKVTDEKGVDFYKVMKSEDGNRFRELALVSAQNSNFPLTNYTLTDPSFNRSTYYTLYRIENGKEILHQTIYVSCNCREPLQFNAFPNPTSGHISLMANQSFNENSLFHLQLISLDGRILIEKMQVYSEMESTLNACLESTSSGIYQIHLAGEELNQHIRIRKL